MKQNRIRLLIFGALTIATLWFWSSPFAATASSTLNSPRLASQFVQTMELHAGDGAPFDQFGSAVAVDGNTMVVGLNYYPEDSSALDAAHVLVRDGDGWTHQDTLTVGDWTEGDQVRAAVAIAGDTILVGTPFADIDGKNRQGAVYVFTRSGESWTQQARLLASDGQAEHYFGRSVAVSGDTAVVGMKFHFEAQGAAYVFTRDEETWSEQARVSASDGEAADGFGQSVAVSGSTVIVGASTATVGDNAQQGALYVFASTGGNWSEQAKVTASDGALGDRLGEALAYDGNTLLAGATQAMVDGVNGRGAAYVFTGSGSDWSEEAKLVAHDHENNRQFGYSVAVNGDTVLVGVPLSNVNGNENQGAAYLFTRSQSGWSQQAKLTRTQGSAHEVLGQSVAIAGETMLVGAPLVDVNGNEGQGIVVVFEPQETETEHWLHLPVLNSD